MFNKFRRWLFTKMYRKELKALVRDINTIDDFRLAYALDRNYSKMWRYRGMIVGMEYVLFLLDLAENTEFKYASREDVLKYGISE